MEPLLAARWARKCSDGGKGADTEKPFFRQLNPVLVSQRNHAPYAVKRSRLRLAPRTHVGSQSCRCNKRPRTEGPYCGPCDRREALGVEC